MDEVMNERITLSPGEYAVPDDCRAVIEGRRVRVVPRRAVRLSDGEYRCRDCRHFADGYSVSAWYTTKVCLMRPKTVRYGRNRDTDVPLHYSARPYGKPCPGFELSEERMHARKSRANGRNTDFRGSDV